MLDLGPSPRGCSELLRALRYDSVKTVVHGRYIILVFTNAIRVKRGK